jgi:hypothetical protein
VQAWRPPHAVPAPILLLYVDCVKSEKVYKDYVMKNVYLVNVGSFDHPATESDIQKYQDELNKLLKENKNNDFVWSVPHTVDLRVLQVYEDHESCECGCK